MSRDIIEAFLEEMKKRHQDEIDAIQLPDGTQEFLQERIRNNDLDTLTFMLKLAYLMGLQTGYAVNQGDDEGSPPATPRGPLQA